VNTKTNVTKSKSITKPVKLVPLVEKKLKKLAKSKDKTTSIENKAKVITDKNKSKKTTVKQPLINKDKKLKETKVKTSLPITNIKSSTKKSTVIQPSTKVKNKVSKSPRNKNTVITPSTASPIDKGVDNLLKEYESKFVKELDIIDNTKGDKND
jgi:hypothetical protein